jgi:hypothetical protein
MIRRHPRRAHQRQQLTLVDMTSPTGGRWLEEREDAREIAVGR